MPNYWGIAGFPISHSITPRLFSLVGDFLGMAQAEQISIEANSLDELLASSSVLRGEIWLSCTSPLKHQLPQLTGNGHQEGVGAINQIRRVDGEWSGVNTDGLGFINACKHFGIDPKDKILKIRGGGSAARAIASSWARSEGLLIPLRGRRVLPPGPWDGAVVDSGNADLAVDMEVPAAGEPSQEIAANRQVTVSYNEGTDPSEFSIAMLAAQHLESWKSFFSPENSDRLPELTEIIAAL